MKETQNIESNLSNTYMTVKEFSQLTSTPIDTLKHYDRIDLLKPALVGDNGYRYYLPQQANILTRILFGSRANITLKEIKQTIINDDPSATMEQYLHVRQNISKQIQELRAIQKTINSLEFFYQLTQTQPLEELFTVTTEDWCCLVSPNQPMPKGEALVTNIANKLYLKGYKNGEWPHYQLGCYFTPLDLALHKFDKVNYYLKIDYPDWYEASDIVNVPGGEYLCVLTKTSEKDINSSVHVLLKELEKNKQATVGNVYAQLAVNNFVSNDRDKYYTIVMVKKSNKRHSK
ncbi:MAG: MerR family DNA-binding transcriptional regulator [Clostridia bacterium]|nr:MerR family DNA-binding transcriptional regulator [Clostridia bacterium]